MTWHDAEAEAAILARLAAGRAGASLCPSEAARRLDPADWRAAMPRIHAAAAALAARGAVRLLRRGRPVAGPAGGPYRIAPAEG